MRHRPITRLLLGAALLLLVRCAVGQINTELDGGEGDGSDGCPEDCPTRCQDGRCPDEELDGDRDGYPASIDCDDERETVHPEADEVCNNIDDDCDGQVDEEIEARSCQSACGEGEETCVDGDWVCSAPDECECHAGETDERPCGDCGTEQRTCGSDLSWGPWGSCTGEGECRPGTEQTQECGLCGAQQRTCSAGCRWEPWSPCDDTGAECSPGEIDDSECTSCSQRICSETCRWGPCQLRPGNTCEWMSGHNFRCCDAAGYWEWCLSDCQWSGSCEYCIYEHCSTCY